MSKTQKTRLRRTHQQHVNRSNLQRFQKRVMDNVNIIRELESLLASK